MSDTFRDDGMGRDARLAELYRTAAREEPPPALDDAIRAAARRAVASRPQRVSPSFVHAWRVPLSIAAVMVLTVSLVTVMREEAPEVISPSGDVRQVGEAGQLRAGPAADAGERAAAEPKTLAPPAPRPDSVGLKPPAQTGAAGLGLRENRISPAPAPNSGKDLAAAGQMETAASSAPAMAKRAVPQAFPEALDTRDDKGVVAAERQRQSAKEGPPASPARAAELMRSAPASAPVPATGPGTAAGAIQSRVDLPPDKWLERIEDLRRQGRLEEARASLGEFRKRHPDYELPASIKAWAGL